MKNHHLASFHFQRGDTQYATFNIANQIQCHPLDEELCVGEYIALVERVQHCMAGAVGCAAGTLYRLFAEIRRMPTKRALVDGAVFIAIKWHAKVFEFNHRFRRCAAHEFNGVLVAQPV